MHYVNVKSIRIEYDSNFPPKYFTLAKSEDWAVVYYIGDDERGYTIFAPRYEMDGDTKIVYTREERETVFNNLIIDHLAGLGLIQPDEWNEYARKSFLEVLNLIL